MISSWDLISRASSITCWPSATVMPAACEREPHGRLDEVDAEGHVRDALLAQDGGDLRGEPVEQAHARRHRAPQAGHAAPDVVVLQPRRVEAVLLGGRAEVPQVRLAGPGQQREARDLVARPLADGGARDVPDVVHVEQQQRAQVRRLERGAGARQPVVAQAAEVDALLEVDPHPPGSRHRGGRERCSCGHGPSSSGPGVYAP